MFEAKICLWKRRSELRKHFPERREVTECYVTCLLQSIHCCFSKRFKLKLKTLIPPWSCEPAPHFENRCFKVRLEDMLSILCYSRETRFSRCRVFFFQCSTVHSRDVPSEPVVAPGPGWDSGSVGGTGSTTMSKSDTFHGPGGFRTPSAPGTADPEPTPGETLQKTGQCGHVREDERQGREVQFTQHKERVRLEEEERKRKTQESSPGGKISGEVRRGNGKLIYGLSKLWGGRSVRLGNLLMR